MARSTLPSTNSPRGNLRAALRVGLIGGAVLALATAGQQAAQTPEMYFLGTLIILVGFSATGYYAARESGARQRRVASGTGAVGGLIAGLIVAVASTAFSLLTALDPEAMRLLEEQTLRQLSPAQVAQLQAAGVELRQLVQLSFGLGVLCIGLGIPVVAALLGALGGATRTSSTQAKPRNS
ncbi:MAG: hypothetical protein RMM31_03300 [Anaerolineae bacterium]|nr:hypothetical protein [Thermoflexales bacterium]MDW8395248.1 hypothetical protein [Anaerolineae bacterium]